LIDRFASVAEKSLAGISEIDAVMAPDEQCCADLIFQIAGLTARAFAPVT
jgi:hypothetical protein